MQVRWLALGVLGAALVPVLFSGRGDQAQTAEEKDTVEPRVLGMRTYYAAPGKMEALHKRFRYHTNKLFVKHGMTIIGYWSPIDPKEAEQKMVYILAYPSREAADNSWKAFRDDP